jgi:protoporphyrinogen oxidase
MSVTLNVLATGRGPQSCREAVPQGGPDAADDTDVGTAIIGGGPAGLTAAYILAKAGASVTVFEADERHLGGLARTLEFSGCRFDIGGHRFFSKSPEIEKLWSEILPDGMLVRPRLSRIYYRGRFYSYPLKPVEALVQLGVSESVRCVVSYVLAQFAPTKEPITFEQWVTNKFGKRLYEIFFKTYTEKVWGMPCNKISADWAAQRIKGLSLPTAVLNAVRRRSSSVDHGQVVKTLVNSFRYPRLGPGMMWEACGDLVRKYGGHVHLGHRVVASKLDQGTGKWRITTLTAEGCQREWISSHVVSSAPIPELILGLRPVPQLECITAASRLRYRDFLTVVLILRKVQTIADNWIYIHDPSVKVGRIQNFRSWSPDMVPDPDISCYGLEYFCFDGDGLWSASDEELIALGASELASVGLANASALVEGCVVRQRKAYPVYDEDYADNVAAVRKELHAKFPNLHLIGRNGMHKYNNQDHAMMTGILTARNILAGREEYDVWDINGDAEYLESEKPATGEFGLRRVPRRV